MSDDLTRAIAEALGCERDEFIDQEGGRRPFCNEHGFIATGWPCPQAEEVAAALAPLIEAGHVHREQQAFDRGYDKAMEGIEARVREAEEERDEVSGRLSELLCDLTGGLLSKPGYDVPTMVQAVEDHFERTVVAVAWQEGYDAALGAARSYGHPDHWEDSPENPYRAEEVCRG